MPVLRGLGGRTAKRYEAGAWVAADVTDVEPDVPPEPEPEPDPDALPEGTLLPGHVPNRVLVGMATPQSGSNINPGWNEARSIIGQPIYEARRFTGNWVSSGNFASMVAEADAANALPVLSWKVPGGSNASGWGEVRDGAHDSGLLTLFNLCADYGKPIQCSFEHEPAGSGINNTALGVWAQMQTRCAYYFAGFRNCTVSASGVVTLGAYNAAHDLSLANGGNLSWGPTGNGFWWRSMTSATLLGNREAAWPQHLIDAVNDCFGAFCNDHYDTDYINQTAALTDPSFRTPGTGVRTHERLENSFAWARERGINAWGIPEFGVIDGPEMDRCWQVFRANRDRLVFVNYFNSQNNSDHEWRIIPSNYPAGNPTGSKGLVDFGGDAQSQGRLDRYRVMLTESVSSTYTSPL